MFLLILFSLLSTFRLKGVVIRKAIKINHSSASRTLYPIASYRAPTLSILFLVMTTYNYRASSLIIRALQFKPHNSLCQLWTLDSDSRLRLSIPDAQLSTLNLFKENEKRI